MGALSELAFIELVVLLLLIMIYILRRPFKKREVRFVVKQPEQLVKPVLIKKSIIKVEKPLIKREIYTEKPKKLKIEKIIVTLMYISVFIFIVFLYFSKPDPGEVSITTEKKVDDIGLFSKLSTLHIDKKNVFGDEEVIDGKTVRKIISSEDFNIIYNPKIAIPANTSGTLTLKFLGSGSEVYLNDKVISPNLDNYALIGEFSDSLVYIDKKYSNDKFLVANNVNDFLYKNFPGESVYSFKDLDFKIPVLDDYTKDWTETDSAFRDNLKLAVFASDSLHVKFVKQDLNSYLGKDEYLLEVKDYSGKVWYTHTYTDDGDNKDSKKTGKEEEYEFKLDDLPASIYYISFTKDKYNKASDSTIKKIRINSNKVMIVDTFLPLTKFEFYTKVVSSKVIGFNYWLEIKEQKIYQEGVESKTIDLDEDWLNKRYNSNLTKQGDYTFSLDKGYLWVYSDIVSFKKSGWFGMPVKEESKFLNPKVLVIDKDKLIVSENELLVKAPVTVNEGTKFKLKVLEENKLYLETIGLDLED